MCSSHSRVYDFKLLISKVSSPVQSLNRMNGRNGNSIMVILLTGEKNVSSVIKSTEIWDNYSWMSLAMRSMAY